MLALSDAIQLFLTVAVIGLAQVGLCLIGATVTVEFALSGQNQQVSNSSRVVKHRLKHGDGQVFSPSIDDFWAI